MPRFQPFRGIRYATAGGRLDTLIAPPYDIISPAEREQLAQRDEHNAVRLELPVEEGDFDRYQAAAYLWARWRESGVLVEDPEPSFYMYRMGYSDEEGRPRQTTGVIGALELSPPDAGEILPHEQTTPKDKADRLELLRACQANLSPIWALSPGEGLSGLFEPTTPPDARATDDQGVHHRLWRITAPGLMGAIAELVGSNPVIVADGHHRYETALAYKEEQEMGPGRDLDGSGSVMAFLVELAEDQLSVQPIHRLVSDLPDGTDVVAELAAHFEVVPASGAPDTLPASMAEAGALGLVTAGGSFLLRPSPTTVRAAGNELDSSRLAVALPSLSPHTLTYQHGTENVLDAVKSGRADAGILLRAASVDQIAATGRGGARMPAKTTYFTPKARTGLVFRSTAG